MSIMDLTQHIEAVFPPYDRAEVSAYFAGTIFDSARHKSVREGIQRRARALHGEYLEASRRRDALAKRLEEHLAAEVALRYCIERPQIDARVDELAKQMMEAQAVARIIADTRAGIAAIDADQERRRALQPIADRLSKLAECIERRERPGEDLAAGFEVADPLTLLPWGVRAAIEGREAREATPADSLPARPVREYDALDIPQGPTLEEVEAAGIPDLCRILYRGAAPAEVARLDQTDGRAAMQIVRAKMAESLSAVEARAAERLIEMAHARARLA